MWIGCHLRSQRIHLKPNSYWSSYDTRFPRKGIFVANSCFISTSQPEKYDFLCFCLDSKTETGNHALIFIFRTIFTPDFRRDLHQLGMDGHVVVPWWVAWPELGCVILIGMHLPQILYICNVCLSYKNTTYMYICIYIYIYYVYIYIYTRVMHISHWIEDSSNVLGQHL